VESAPRHPPSTGPGGYPEGRPPCEAGPAPNGLSPARTVPGLPNPPDNPDNFVRWSPFDRTGNKSPAGGVWDSAPRSVPPTVPTLLAGALPDGSELGLEVRLDGIPPVGPSPWSSRGIGSFRDGLTHHNISSGPDPSDDIGDAGRAGWVWMLTSRVTGVVVCAAKSLRFTWIYVFLLRSIL